MKRVDLIRHLQSNACELLREGGRHSVFINRVTQARATVPRHRELKSITAGKICQQLGIPEPSKR